MSSLYWLFNLHFTSCVLGVKIEEVDRVAPLSDDAYALIQGEVTLNASTLSVTSNATANMQCASRNHGACLENQFH